MRALWHWARGFLGLPAAVFSVLGVVGTVVWIVTVVTARHHRPLNFWLVVTVALIAIGAILWGVRQRARAGEPQQVHHHHYAPGTTVQFGQASDDAERTSVGPPVASGDTREVVRLADHVEYGGPGSGPPVIRDREFRNVIVRGPLVVLPLTASFTRVEFLLPNADPNSIFFVTPDDERYKGGIAGLVNCVFENCQMDQIAFVGSAEARDHFRREIGL
jgi:hypothetical protein